MSINEIRKLVEKRVSESIIQESLNFLIRRHKNNGFRDGCDCDYCTMKIEATRELNYNFYDDKLSYTSKQKSKNRYRQILESLV